MPFYYTREIGSRGRIRTFTFGINSAANYRLFDPGM